MMPYRRRARFNSDRFDNVRDRERFMYEPVSDQEEEDWYDDEGQAEPLIRYAVIGVGALLLTGSILIGAYYLSDQLIDNQLATSHNEPVPAAALPPPDYDNCRTQNCAQDKKTATIAWQYFENNLHADTGLVNSVDQVETTTMWDTGSSIAAFIAARDFGLISQHRFDHTIMTLLETLSTAELVENAAPNILYHTRTATMVDYSNAESAHGIGISTIDLARTAFWLNALQCMHPKYYNPVNRVLARWDYSKLINDEQLYGLARNHNGESVSIQQGRFGFEQYAGQVFGLLGHATAKAANFNNDYRTNTEILGIRIAHDSRDPRETGVNNFVVTDSYTLHAMELGLSPENHKLLKNIFDVQKKRWQKTGIATALTDGHINQPPHYLYNTVFDAGLSFTTTTDTGVRHDDLRTVSTKAAFALAALFPEDFYADVLLSAVESAYNPDVGWFSGVYENGGFNDTTTANTNGIILQTMLYKKYGSLTAHCEARPNQPELPSQISTTRP